MFENNKGLVWEVIKNMHIYATKDMDLEDKINEVIAKLGIAVIIGLIIVAYIFNL